MRADVLNRSLISHCLCVCIRFMPFIYMFFGTAMKRTSFRDHFLPNCFRFLVLYTVYSSGLTTDMYYLLDTVPPIRVVCKNVATVNIPPKMAASSVISVKVCLWTRSVVVST